MVRDSTTTSSPKKDKRRLDVTLTDAGTQGKALGIDVSVASPLADSVINKTEPLAAAIDREQEKIRKYSQDCTDHDMDFSPFVMDTYGGIPDLSYREVLRKLTSMINDYAPVNWAAPTPETYWLQRVSIALWTGNARKAQLLVRESPPKT